GLDLMAFHGINPRTAAASAVIGTNHFDGKVTQKVTIVAKDNPDTNIEAAIALVQGGDRDVNGLVMAPVFKSALAAQTTTDGAKLYPELAWGNNPGSVNGLRTEATSNLSANASLDRALVGDFTGAFKWGYAKQIPIEVIRYGNPDNDATLGDLKGHNQIYLRGEMYIGWGILDASAFAFVKAGV
ncbi:MAG: phage major capsid protein, partial [Ruthenibacterium sp.]